MPKAVINRKVRMRERGQFTVPVEIREHLGLKEDSILQVLSIGRAMVVIPEETMVNELARQVEYVMKNENMNLEELLSSLREGSHEYESD
ncbi:MAG: AbrB/MazE/SpoVT family DNA-binding domain-containing protein [Syntrophomonas sp.]|uniref:AbrB/MazE/SpoVT family DNA-binding domain-containing protein n=1 Tax=Syntrophomonas sp. TaxID=2053627 RepID=UPI00260763C3|nr:AbrB/MazE/SpoVT family DNA-binding domain-containing protein [Syntrophomonas sp.]MDD2509920.1 AbrB/MazE/SpoVT family DNA-binding domain-containing protein [Syntrophomonas sp.]MDD3878669.1 AbrB/MazE/SpoVT family DNA-binding domain-containing protein [Syntrophomonas sp.]MDD4626048.1 AbrB/MazE/SpoVT family DNA-binding domain-containing protein [Syntrophomonas sp.]